MRKMSTQPSSDSPTGRRVSLLPIVLRYVDQVARSGSIQGAAKELHVAASAVNRQVLALERELGVALFERLPRGMRLTPPGDLIVTLARRWRNDERRVASDIRQMQGIHQGHVRVFAMDSHSTSVLPRLVERLVSEHPRISLSIELGSSDDAVAALLAGKADVAAVFNLSPRGNPELPRRGSQRDRRAIRLIALSVCAGSAGCGLARFLAGLTSRRVGT